MKYQVLFSLKTNEQIFLNVVWCSRDSRLKEKLLCPSIKRYIWLAACILIENFVLLSEVLKYL